MGCNCKGKGKRRTDVSPRRAQFCLEGPDGERTEPFPRIYEARVEKDRRGSGWRVVPCS